MTHGHDKVLTAALVKNGSIRRLSGASFKTFSHWPVRNGKDTYPQPRKHEGEMR